MDIDAKIALVKDLIQKREEIDSELAVTFGITLKTKKILRCSRCGERGPQRENLSDPTATIRDSLLKFSRPLSDQFSDEKLPSPAQARRVFISGSDCCSP